MKLLKPFLYLAGTATAATLLFSGGTAPTTQTATVSQPTVSASVSSTASTTAPAVVAPQPATVTAPVQKQYESPSAQEAEPSGLSNDNYYENVDGNTVHSPAYSNSIPAGASAQCRDGTYSFSQNRRGTCSHHGGVAEWY